MPSSACASLPGCLHSFPTRRSSDLVGLNYKDDYHCAMRWLEEAGNPYAASIVDRTGETAIDYGVYGVPETFVIDRAGIVRYRLAGPRSEEHTSELQSLRHLVCRLLLAHPSPDVYTPSLHDALPILWG